MMIDAVTGDAGDVLSIDVSGDHAKPARHHAHPAPNALFLIHKRASGFILIQRAVLAGEDAIGNFTVTAHGRHKTRLIDRDLATGQRSGPLGRLSLGRIGKIASPFAIEAKAFQVIRAQRVFILRVLDDTSHLAEMAIDASIWYGIYDFHIFSLFNPKSKIQNSSRPGLLNSQDS
jgi:hypothetical protein